MGERPSYPRESDRWQGYDVVTARPPSYAGSGDYYDDYNGYDGDRPRYGTAHPPSRTRRTTTVDAAGSRPVVVTTSMTSPPAMPSATAAAGPSTALSSPPTATNAIAPLSAMLPPSGSASVRPRSPTRNEYRSSDSQFYTQQHQHQHQHPQPPPTPYRGHRPSYSTTAAAIDRGDYGTGNDTANGRLVRDRPESMVMAPARGGSDYRPARPSVYYYDTSSARQPEASYSRQPETTEYDEDGWGYTNPSSMARYDLDHPPLPPPQQQQSRDRAAAASAAAAPNRRQTVYQPSYNRPSVMYHERERERERPAAAAAAATAAGASAAAHGVDRLPRYESVPPAAPVPPMTHVVSSPLSIQDPSTPVGQRRPLPLGSAGPRPRPVTLYQDSNGHAHDDYYTGREAERNMREIRDRERESLHHHQQPAQHRAYDGDEAVGGDRYEGRLALREREEPAAILPPPPRRRQDRREREDPRDPQSRYDEEYGLNGRREDDRKGGGAAGRRDGREGEPDDRDQRAGGAGRRDGREREPDDRDGRSGRKDVRDPEDRDMKTSRRDTVAGGGGRDRDYEPARSSGRRGGKDGGGRGGGGRSDDRKPNRSYDDNDDDDDDDQHKSRPREDDYKNSRPHGDNYKSRPRNDDSDDHKSDYKSRPASDKQDSTRPSDKDRFANDSKARDDDRKVRGGGDRDGTFSEEKGLDDRQKIDKAEEDKGGRHRLRDAVVGALGIGGMSALFMGDKEDKDGSRAKAGEEDGAATQDRDHKEREGKDRDVKEKEGREGREREGKERGAATQERDNRERDGKDRSSGQDRDGTERDGRERDNGDREIRDRDATRVGDRDRREKDRAGDDGNDVPKHRDRDPAGRESQLRLPAPDDDEPRGRPDARRTRSRSRSRVGATTADSRAGLPIPLPGGDTSSDSSRELTPDSDEPRRRMQPTAAPAPALHQQERAEPRKARAFNPNDTTDLRSLRDELAAIHGEDIAAPTSSRRGGGGGGQGEKLGTSLATTTALVPAGAAASYGGNSGDESRGREMVVAGLGESRPIKGILKAPTSSFPEDPNPIREGVAPHKDDRKLKEVPPGARWTKISRKMVNPDALTLGKERFEERDDFVVVLRVLSKEEIQAYVNATRIIRERRRAAAEKDHASNHTDYEDDDSRHEKPTRHRKDEDDGGGERRRRRDDEEGDRQRRR